MPFVRHQFLVQLGYDGARFHGVAPQLNQMTVTQALQRRIADAGGGWGKALAFTARTDAGVHAQENFATFWLPSDALKSSREKLAFIEQFKTPRNDGLQIRSFTPCDRSVHARNIAWGKHYTYRLLHGFMGPECPARTWGIVPTLDVPAMQIAAQWITGTHDFSAFRAAGCGAGTTVKTLEAVDIVANDDAAWTEDGVTPEKFVAIHLRGDAFLRKMVRIIVGTLVEIGIGLRAPEEITTILESKRRDSAGHTAAARGLTLERVLRREVSDPEARPI